MRSIRRRVRRALREALLLALAMPAPGRAADLNYIETSRPLFLNPVDGARDIIGIRALQLIYRGLVRQDDLGNWIPDMALNLAAYDSTTQELVFQLRPLTWPDGTPITAQDVVHSFYTYRDVRSRYGNADILEIFAEARTEGEMTVRFRLAMNHPSAMARAGFLVMPKHRVGEDTYIAEESPFNQEPMGAGPYRLAYTEDNLLSFERNPNYHGAPKIDTVDLMVNPSEDTQHQLLMSGGLVHVDPIVRPQDLPVLKASAEHVVRPYASQTWYGFAYNTRNGILQFREVRQAFSLSYNRQLALEAGFAGQGALVSGPYTSASFCFNRDVAPYDYDPAEANAVLDGLGLLDLDDDGVREHEGQPIALRMVLSKAMSDENKTVCRDFRSQLEALRIKVDLDYQDQRVWYDRVFMDHDYDITFVSWKFDDASNIYPLFSRTQQAPGQYNICLFENDEVEAQLELFRATANDAERAAAGQQLHQLLHEHSPYTFLWTVEHSAAYVRSHIKKIRIQPFSFFTYIDEWELE